MRKRLAITSLSLLVLVGSAALLGACNTTAGVGKDMVSMPNELSSEVPK